MIERLKYLVTAYEFGNQRIELPKMAFEDLVVHEAHAVEHLGDRYVLKKIL